ncbi:MAG: MMPL family transporter [Polyangiaceae bacterium]
MSGASNETQARGLVHLWAVALEAFARLITRRPWTFVIVGLLTFVPTGYLASKLTLRSSFMDLLSHDDPEVKDLDVVLEKTGGLGYTIVAVPAEDRPRGEAYAVELGKRLGQLPDVRFVQARLDVEFLADHQLYYASPAELSELTGAVKSSIDYRVQKAAGMLLDDEDAPPDPLPDMRKKAAEKKVDIQPFVVGNDGRYIYVMVVLSSAVSDLDVTQRAQAEVERVAKELAAEQSPALEVRFTGPVVNRLADTASLQVDLTRAGTIGFIGVVLMVLLGTRRLRSMPLLGIPLAVGLTWTFAFAYVAVHHLNAVSGFLVSILSGLGIEYGIHLYRRYVDERREGLSPEEATVLTLKSTGGALLAACIVNAAVFAVVGVAGFRGFTEFGLIASVGMLLTMSATFLLFPPLNLVFDRRWPVIKPAAVKKDDEREASAARPRPAFVRFALSALRVLVLGAVPIFVVYSGHGLATQKVRFHTDWRKLGADTESARFDQYVVSTLGQSITQVMLYLDDPSQVSTVREAVEAVRARRAASGKPFNVVRVVGIDDLVPHDQPAKAAEIEKLAAQLKRAKPSKLTPDEREMLDKAKQLTAQKPFTEDDIPASLTQQFHTADKKGTMVIITSDALLEDSAKLIDWADQMAELRQELKDRKVVGALASENAIAGRIFRIIAQSGTRILGATFLVVFLVLLLEFRRLSHAIIVLSSVALGMLFVAGGMALFHIDLNMMNAAVLPIVVGVSLDNAIHIFHRFEEDGPASIPAVMRSTGVAAILSSATNLAGFAALFIARHGGLRSVAMLSSLGIASTVFTTTVIFPLVLDLVGRMQRPKLAPAKPPKPAATGE